MLVAQNRNKYPVYQLIKQFDQNLQSEVDSKIRNDLEVGLYEEGSEDFYAAWDDEVDKAKNKSLKKYLEQEIQNLPFNAVTRLHPFSNFY